MAKNKNSRKVIWLIATEKAWNDIRHNFEERYQHGDFPLWETQSHRSESGHYAISLAATNSSELTSRQQDAIKAFGRNVRLFNNAKEFEATRKQYKISLADPLTPEKREDAESRKEIGSTVLGSTSVDKRGRLQSNFPRLRF